MLAVCRGNRGNSLPDDVREGYGLSPLVKYHITLDRKYGVYSIALWGYGLAFLLVDDSQRPHWYPAQLFEPFTSEMPTAWAFSTLSGENDPVKALWGYPSMISDTLHHDALIERKLSALEVFLNEAEMVQEADQDVLAFSTLRRMLRAKRDGPQ